MQPDLAPERADLRSLLAAASPCPWEGEDEPEFVGLFAGPEPGNLGGYLGEIRSHANAALVLALVNGAEALLDALDAAEAAPPAPAEWEPGVDGSEILRLHGVTAHVQPGRSKTKWDVSYSPEVLPVSGGFDTAEKAMTFALDGLALVAERMEHKAAEATATARSIRATLAHLKKGAAP